MNKIFYSIILILWNNILIAQIPTFSEHIAPIIFSNCTKCHRPNNIAPFSLTNYNEVFGAANSILDAVNNKLMPPWPPDPDYHHFLNERVLSSSEIQAINDWVSFGMPLGDTSLIPPLPTFIEGSEIGIPDVQFNLPVYTLTTNQDEYRCFVIPSQFSQEVYIKAFEFLPGNKLIDHHAVIFWDTSGVCQQLDDSTIELGYNSASSFAGTDNAQKISIWVPGSPPLILPPNFGYRIPANADIIVQMHYPEASFGLVDSSKLNIFLQSGINIRNVKLKTTINIIHIIDGPLVIPADSIKTFHAESTIPINTSVLAVMPHMHLLGKNTVTYAVQPNGDTMKLVSIPRWDFHWQGFYVYEKLVLWPTNTIIKSEFTYDNTSSNLLNPNSPPQTVYYGNGSDNEMMVTAFLTVPYKQGDENIFLYSADTSVFESEISIYPNPTNGNFTVNFNFINEQIITASVYSVTGARVKNIFSNLLIKPDTHQQLINLSELTSGIYFLKINSNNLNIVKRIAIIH